MRILVTGLGTVWGSRVAQRLERQPGVDLVVGVDTREPRLPLEKTEFVRADSSYAILQRILAATRVDTIVHTHLITDSSEVRSRALHEINVIGTTNLACRGRGRRQHGAQARREGVDARVRLER